MDYRSAGVDLAAAELLVRRVRGAVTDTWHDGVVTPFGGFAAGLRLPEGFRDPVLMMSTDGVGTKGEIARMAGWYEALGYDLVAMCADDLVSTGARPLAMVDYLAVGALDEERDEALIRSIARACSHAGCVLLGGETAEHPGVMEPWRFDLAGAALGVVEADSLVDGSRIEPGHRVIGISSPNLRSNGFSLVRVAVLPRLALADPFPGTDRPTAEVLLEPSVIYAPAVLGLLERVPVHGLAHVTGGGLAGNLARILPGGRRAVIDRGSWEVPGVFRAVAEIGGIRVEEMERTFNMGVGFTVVVPPGSAEEAVATLLELGHQSWLIGTIEEGEPAVGYA